MSTNKKKYRLLSLFSGCWGLDLWFRGNFEALWKKYASNNFQLIWANDFDRNACSTFQSYFNEDIVCGDIRELLAWNYPDLLSSKMPEEVDVVIWWFPCQDFSLAWKRKWFGSLRWTLYQSMVEVVRRTKPLIFLAENVKGLLSMNEGQAIEKIKQDFADLWYEVDYKLFHVADFWVPQNRERVIIIWTKKDKWLNKFEFPKWFLDKQSWVSIGEAISDLENVEEGWRPNHYWSKAKMIEWTQGNSYTAKNKIAPTMRAEHHWNIEWHWNKKRRLSAREAARIQTFPDNMIFLPSTSSAYKQIWNAVPPVFWWHIANSIQKYLNTNLWKK